MKRVLVLFLALSLFVGFELLASVHAGQLELSTFVGRQSIQRDGNATFSGGIQIGLELVELGTIEFSAETGFGAYPDNDQKVRNFDVVLKSIIYHGEMFFPYILGGIGLMTLNRTSDTSDPEQSSVTFARTTTNFGAGFKIRIKKDFYGRTDLKYFLFSKNGSLTYRSLLALGLSYAF